MVLALHDAETHDGIVYLAKRLIVPLVGARLHKRWNVDNIERIEFDVEMYGIREGGSIRCRHRCLPCSDRKITHLGRASDCRAWFVGCSRRNLRQRTRRSKQALPLRPYPGGHFPTFGPAAGAGQDMGMH